MLTQEGPARLLRGATALALLATLIISRPLWLNSPYFGPQPIAVWIPIPSDALLIPWHAALVLLLLPVGLAARPRPWILAWLSLLIARCAWDSIVWQPYLLTYGLVLAACLRPPRDAEQPSSGLTAASIQALRIMVVAVYAWSAFSKTDISFANNGPQLYLAPFEDVIRVQAFAGRGWLAALGEALVALLLALPSTLARRAGVIGAGLMHLAILVILGPWGMDTNPVVWPWNLAMLLLVSQLFWPSAVARTSHEPAAWRAQPGLMLAVFVFCLLGPALSWFGYWSPYLSYRLYSYQYPFGALWLSSELQRSLPPEAQAEAVEYRRPPYASVLQITAWSEAALGAFMPPSESAYRRVASRVCDLETQSGQLELVVELPPEWGTGHRERLVYGCDDLD